MLEFADVAKVYRGGTLGVHNVRVRLGSGLVLTHRDRRRDRDPVNPRRDGDFAHAGREAVVAAAIHRWNGGNRS
jgi:hypothetical protein